MSDDSSLTHETVEPESPKSESEVIDGIPDIPQDVLDKLPNNVKQVLGFFHSQRVGFPAHPLMEKMNAGHIDTVLNSAEEDSKRNHTEWKWGKFWGIVYSLIFIALFIFLVVFLIDRKPEYILELIKYAAIFAGGFGAKAIWDKHSEE
jgi:hypothetical protein